MQLTGAELAVSRPECGMDYEDILATINVIALWLGCWIPFYSAMIRFINHPERTAWFNFGLWDGIPANRLSTAAKQLVHLVIDKAHASECRTVGTHHSAGLVCVCIQDCQ